jgi:hypothetical protein
VYSLLIGVFGHKLLDLAVYVSRSMLKGEYWKYVQELFRLGAFDFRYVTVLPWKLYMYAVTNVT